MDSSRHWRRVRIPEWCVVGDHVTDGQTLPCVREKGGTGGSGPRDNQQRQACPGNVRRWHWEDNLTLTLHSAVSPALVRLFGQLLCFVFGKSICVCILAYFILDNPRWCLHSKITSVFKYFNQTEVGNFQSAGHRMPVKSSGCLKRQISHFL